MHLPQMIRAQHATLRSSGKALFRDVCGEDDERTVAQVLQHSILDEVYEYMITNFMRGDLGIPVCQCRLTTP